MMEAKVTDQKGSIGERRERARRAGLVANYVVLALLGGAVGFAFAVYESGGTAWADGTIPPTVAIVLSVVTLVAMIGGCLFMKRRIDEVELRHNLYAGATAAVTVLIGYPVWYFLWKGQLVPEPSHVAMFGALYLMLALTYLIRKFR